MPLSNRFWHFGAVRMTRTAKSLFSIFLASLLLFSWGIFSSVHDGRSSRSFRQAENTIISDSDVIQEESLLQQLAAQDHVVADLADGAELSDGLALGTGEWPTPPTQEQ